jgi:5-methylcytosine-specific restriction endonuclease McrA
MTHNSYVRRKWPDSITPETPTNLELLQWVEAEFPKKCVYCGSPAEHIDHIIPLSKGGLHILVNLQPTCGRCNKAKGNDSDEDFRKWLELFTTRFV